MNLMQTISKLASDGVDLMLQPLDTKRIGAEAERRGLFMAYMRNATAETLTDELRDRSALFAHVSDEELRAEFEARGMFSTKHAPLSTLVTDAEQRGFSALRYALNGLSETSAKRDASWPTKGEFSVMERAAELCEEAGEAAGNAKKLRRLEIGMAGNRNKDGSKIRDDLEYEIGDVLICAANLANKAGVSLYAGLVRAFNTRSEELGLPERIR